MFVVDCVMLHELCSAECVLMCVVWILFVVYNVMLYGMCSVCVLFVT